MLLALELIDFIDLGQTDSCVIILILLMRLRLLAFVDDLINHGQVIDLVVSSDLGDGLAVDGGSGLEGAGAGAEVRDFDREARAQRVGSVKNAVGRGHQDGAERRRVRIPARQVRSQGK